MRIAILGTRGIPARYGGFESFAEHLAAGLRERGFDVTVFCETSNALKSHLWNGVRLEYASAPALGPLSTIVYDVQCLWAARKGYDLVYMLGYGAAPFCVIPRLWSTTVWINPDGIEWARAKWNPIAKLYFRLMEWTSIHSANRVIADAEAIEASLTSRHGHLKACTVIPYGCEIIEIAPPVSRLSKWELEPEGYYLVVCRLEPENHVREILQAFRFSTASRKLIVVGNQLSGTKYVTSLLQIEDPRIHMIGTIYDEQELTCLRYHSFAYIHGHSVGGTNPSLLEAMGCGNFVIAHDNPFNRETLSSAGLFFADPGQLTEAIESIETDPSQRENFSIAARVRARDFYSWGRIISSYAELMRSLEKNEHK